MAQAFQITDKDGVVHLVVVSRIKGAEAVPAEPGEPAVEAADAVEDDPGEEPSATNPVGRPPLKGHPKIEAKPAKPGVPESVKLSTEDGEIEAPVSMARLLDMINF